MLMNIANPGGRSTSNPHPPGTLRVESEAAGMTGATRKYNVQRARGSRLPRPHSGHVEGFSCLSVAERCSKALTFSKKGSHARGWRLCRGELPCYVENELDLRFGTG